jgi:predicted RecB family nuclease
VARKGDEHERDYLESLRADDREVVEIPQPSRNDPKQLIAAADRTAMAMQEGAEVIYQATFFQDRLRGHADFLFRRDDRPSALGDWSYEVADTKLARRAKPYYIFQLCFYSELLQHLQGGAPPEHIHVILGTGEQHTYRLAEFSAYFRHIRDRFLAKLGAGVPDTYPDPVEHCAICQWRERCDKKRIADDHLSLVAHITSLQIGRLNDAGIWTLAELAALPGDMAIPRVRGEMLHKLHDQASLQLRGRESGGPLLRYLPPEPGRGFHRLPPPSEGDVFFDMEGDPFFDQGLEYLFGVVTLADGEPRFTPFWGRDRAEEKRAFEDFIDFVVSRRERFPDLHVYHYAHYEPTALKRLAGAHGTREEELDDLLRNHVFVDLYKGVKEGMRISQPGYGLKKVEAFYMGERETAVTDGNDSVIEFERWLEEGDDSILQAIAEYNRDDCVSTLKLREWLLEQRDAAAAEYGAEIAWEEPTVGERSEERVEIHRETAELADRLLEGVPADREEASEEQRNRALLAYLLQYHRREERPVWWMFFSRIDAEPDDLIDDADCVAGLTEDEESEPRPVKRSIAYRLRFPTQETKVGPGSYKDQRTGRDGGTVIEIDRPGGWLDLKRGPRFDGVSLPGALIPGGPYDTQGQQTALRSLASEVLANGFDGDGPYRAARDILLRYPPRLRGRERGEPLQAGSLDIEEMKAIVHALDSTCLFIQGPPGSGKTWRGARLIVDLIDRGNRVGVAANSHKAIHKLLDEIEQVAEEDGVELHGLKKATSSNAESRFESKLDEELIGNTTKDTVAANPDVKLVGGMAWHFCNEIVRDQAPLDYLFIDEAGQVSLADALAMSTAARNIVLLGDPQQLPQVIQGAHPNNAATSVLEHLLGDRQTIPPEEGLFLDRSFRMHPDVCAFVSEIMYEGRLHSAEECAAQFIDCDGELTGTGLRWIPVEHQGNSQESPEEAQRIAELMEALRDGNWTGSNGISAPIGHDDILVVAPYNAQVRCLTEALPAGTRVGTVDKFQGQEAAVVIFSMATSSSAELPRNLEFLFSRNRLNVAISRARCLAAIVASPDLLETDCRTIGQMRLVNALCRAAEVASLAPSADTP